MYLCLTFKNKEIKKNTPNNLQPVHKQVKWSFIENILEKEAWKRHEKFALEDKIRSFIRKPYESYHQVKQSMYRYMRHVSWFAEHSILKYRRKKCFLTYTVLAYPVPRLSGLFQSGSRFIDLNLNQLLIFSTCFIWF